MADQPNAADAKATDARTPPAAPGAVAKGQKRVRILSTIIGKPAIAAGEILDLEDEIADAWIADGLATLERTGAAATTSVDLKVKRAETAVKK